MWSFFTKALRCRVREKTFRRYQASLRLFLFWCLAVGVVLDTVEQLDLAIVSYQEEEQRSKHQTEELKCAAQFFFPGSKKHLFWTSEVIKGLHALHPAQHTLPLDPDVALVICLYLAVGLRCPRLAAGFLIQFARGLRPGELINIKPNQVFSTVQDGVNCIVISLGTRSRPTKVRRQQYVIFHGVRECLAVHLLVALFHSCTTDTLVGCSYSHYYRQLKFACQALGLQWYTPQSPRAGWATKQVLMGVIFNKIKDDGRWGSDTSCRRYLDVITALGAQTAHDRTTVALQIDFLTDNFFHVFPWDKL